MNENRTRWTDDRLDDALEVLRGANLPTRMRVIEEAFKFLAEDLHECRNGVDGLTNSLAERAKEREEERRTREKDKKSDRRWLVGTVLTATSLVIAAMALLVDKF